MERVDAILRHPTFTAALAELHEQERERIFCRHGLAVSYTHLTLPTICSV